MADADSLTEIEPSPVEETPIEFKEGYFPPTAHSSRLGLSGSHTTLWYLSRIQKYSTYAFSAFGLAHITNTSIIPLITQSVPASEPYLLLTRPYYQGIPFEPILVIVPLWAHVLSSVAMRVYRRNLNAKRYGDSETKGAKNFFSARYWPAVSGISKLGFQFTILLAGHIYLQRAVPNDFPGGSSNINLSYVSHAFARHPAISFAGFTALLTVGCFHMTWGWAKWLGFTPDQVTTVGQERALVRKRRWYTVNGLAAGLTALWMAGSFGVVARAGAANGWLAKLYDEMFASIPLSRLWV
ncbi:hypothetical protein BDY17DRAFT_289677 [Neohortaea acidophila]|uniref:Mitochondrial adapter protein MCP1 transmembrane domain-containing protein n=1 Tax=Neohortaea acidophila TaxID=245834 RepID=A0A6A6Q811_9PEZI|nr:uncharacterized protein BDY17DRAFT_289677 [Neohortaea acidophila]KAF2487783.1 hypothetical protein BDY17DRAFT_289677 [Neohortaea acidophila]